MRPIQAILILFATLVSVLYFRKLRPRLVDRAVLFLIALAAILMIAQPEWANGIANAVGVGRGADMVTYLGISGLGFLWLRLYIRQRELEAQLTELARQLTIEKAELPKRAATRKSKKRANDG